MSVASRKSPVHSQTTLRRFVIFLTTVGLELVSSHVGPTGQLVVLRIDTGLGHDLGDVDLSFAASDLGLLVLATRGLAEVDLGFAALLVPERVGLRLVITTCGMLCFRESGITACSTWLSSSLSVTCCSSGAGYARFRPRGECALAGGTGIGEEGRVGCPGQPMRTQGISLSS